jgi:hypothetical protein
VTGRGQAARAEADGAGVAGAAGVRVRLDDPERGRANAWFHSIGLDMTFVAPGGRASRVTCEAEAKAAAAFSGEGTVGRRRARELWTGKRAGKRRNVG